MSEITENEDLTELLEYVRKPFGIMMQNSFGDHSPIMAVPDGYTIEDVSRFLDHPSRPMGGVILHDVSSFIAYVTKHGALQKVEDGKPATPMASTSIYAKSTKSPSNEFKTTIIAVLNDHEEILGIDEPTPGWGDYTATLSPAVSLEWETWIKNDRKEMTQVAFANFIEDNLVDIRPHDGQNHPAAADMLQMAIQFEAFRNKVFQSSVDTQSGGVALNYVDKDNDATKSRMQAFERFGIAIPVYQSGPNEEAILHGIAARLKYKQDGTSLKLWYELIRPDRVFRDATSVIIKKIEDAGFPVLMGERS